VKVAEAFATNGIDEIKALLDGGSLTVYSVARPSTPDITVDFSAVLVVFTFATPAFGPSVDGVESPAFVEESVASKNVGTPGFARATKADGTVVADFSAGPGNREIKLSEISCTHGAPIKITKFQILPEGAWPEKPEYYETRPRPGYALPRNP